LSIVYQCVSEKVAVPVALQCETREKAEEGEARRTHEPMDTFGKSLFSSARSRTPPELAGARMGPLYPVLPAFETSVSEPSGLFRRFLHELSHAREESRRSMTRIL
jgi:hypothetical protein